MKLTNKNYYSQKANKEYFSVSQLKDFIKCEAYAMAKISGEWVEEPTTPMLMGSYVDSWFEGTLDKFKENTPDLFKKDGTLKSDYVMAEEVIKIAQEEPFLMNCMSGKKQVIMTGEIFGVPWKIKMDSYIKDEAIVDFKFIKNISEKFKTFSGYQTFIEQWGYDLQLAVYQEIVRQNTGKTLDCIIAAIDKTKYHNRACVLISNDQLSWTLQRYEEIIPHYAQVKAGKIEPEQCNICDYCIATKKIDHLIEPYQLIM